MRPRAAALALLLVLAPVTPLGAQALDPNSADALAAAVKVLLDPTLRAGAIAGNPQAGAADQTARALTRSDALTQELYALAAQIFSELAASSGGDAAKMSQTLVQARSNPAAFAASLSPQTLERLRLLSTKITHQPR
jgi:hypothetical protein